MLSGISIPGTLQGKWWNFAFTDLRQVPDASEKELMEIAEEKAAHFLSYDSVRPMVNLVFFCSIMSILIPDGIVDGIVSSILPTASSFPQFKPLNRFSPPYHLSVETQETPALWF